MIIQALNDCTITIKDPAGYYVLGIGELLTLPLHLAIQVLLGAPDHFKVVKPTPLIPGVAVCWLLPDDRRQGPGIVQLVDGVHPDRTVAVQVESGLRWIHERDIISVDPWPVIDERLDGIVEHFLIDGEENPKVIEVQEWLFTHFDDSEDPWKR